MLSPGEIAEINRRVDLRRLAEDLGAKFQSKRNYGTCPICGGGRSAARFEIKGDAWVCAVCNDGGDAISLVQKVKGVGFSEAVEILGGPVRLSPAERERQEARAKSEREKRRLEAARYRERERKRLYHLWQAAKPILGTPIEAYLCGRGLTWRLDRLRLRHVADLPYFDGETTDERGFKVPRVIHRGPAMLCPFLDASGRFLGLHITWVQPDGQGKAEIVSPEGEVLSAKKMRGHKQGGFLDVAPGEAQRIVCGEGIETVLSPREALRDYVSYRAAGDLGNLAGGATETIAHPTLKRKNGHPERVPGPEPDFDSEAMPVPAECRELVLLVDADCDPVLMANALARAGKRHAAKGRVVRAARPTPGQDFNSMLTI